MASENRTVFQPVQPHLPQKTSQLEPGNPQTCHRATKRWTYNNSIRWGTCHTRVIKIVPVAIILIHSICCVWKWKDQHCLPGHRKHITCFTLLIVSYLACLWSRLSQLHMKAAPFVPSVKLQSLNCQNKPMEKLIWPCGLSRSTIWRWIWLKIAPLKVSLFLS